MNKDSDDELYREPETPCQSVLKSAIRWICFTVVFLGLLVFAHYNPTIAIEATKEASMIVFFLFMFLLIRNA